MKKILLSLAVASMSLTAFAESKTIDFSADTFTPALPSTEMTTATKYTDSTVGIDLEMLYCKKGTYSGQSYLQVSGKNNTGAYVSFTPTFAVSQIALTTGSNASTNVTVTVTAGTTAIKENLKLETKGGVFTIDVPAGTAAGTTYKIEVTNKYNAQLTKIELTQAGTASKKAADLVFSETSFTVKMGQAFTAPTLTKATNADVVYSTSDAEVADVVAATGVVTIKGVGTATITAKTAENDEYYAGEATYTINVLDANTILDSPMGADFTFENPEDLAVWSVDASHGYLKGSAYKGGVRAATAYAVSPVIDLTNRTDVKLTFKNAFNQYKLNNALIDVADFAGKYAFIVAREEDATEWTQVAEPTAPEAFNWIFFDNDSISLDAYKGKKMQFAFKYVSTADVAGTWEVKGISVTGTDTGVGIVDAIADDVNAPVRYYNLQGVEVANPTDGLFIRVQGKKATKVIIRK